MHTPMLARAALAAVALSFVLPSAARADASPSDSSLTRQPDTPTEQPAREAATSAAAPASAAPASAVERAALRATESRARIDKLPAAAFTRGGGVLTQTDSVRTACFPAALRGALQQISAHFGKPVVVTSGLRGGGRRGSFHRTCQAADIQIAGVSPGAIARYARSLDAVGGVGTYGHTRSVHVDVGDRVFSWHGARRRNAALGTGGCCPVCAAMAANQTGQENRPRFEASCAG